MTGSVTISGSGGMYTYDDANNVWMSETFTIAEQTVQTNTDPTLVSMTSSPSGTMTVDIDDTTYAVSGITGVDMELSGGALDFDVDPMSVTVNLDAGGTTTINLLGSGGFTPLDWTSLTTVSAGMDVDVVAAAGPIPLGYLFQISAEELNTGGITVDPLVIDPSAGRWYEFGAETSVDFGDLAVHVADTGTFSVNTFSGSEYPYYALTLDYELISCGTLLDVEADLSGVGPIPEPTTLALLMAGFGGLWLRRRA